MKKKLVIVLCLVLMLTLGGCLGDGSAENPDTAADGTPWSEDWTSLGGILGLEQPGGGFALLDTNGDLANMEMYYATWVIGEPIPVDDESSVYDAQLYMLVEDCGSATVAADTMALWKEQFGDEILVTETRTVTAAGQEFELVFYDCPEGEHFESGITAIGVWGRYGILVDLASTQNVELALEDVMTAFLEGFHYSAL